MTVFCPSPRYKGFFFPVPPPAMVSLGYKFCYSSSSGLRPLFLWGTDIGGASCIFYDRSYSLSPGLHHKKSHFLVFCPAPNLSPKHLTETCTGVCHWVWIPFCVCDSQRFYMLIFPLHWIFNHFLKNLS